MRTLIISCVTALAVLGIALVASYWILTRPDPVREAQTDRLTSISPAARAILRDLPPPVPALPIAVARKISDSLQADFSARQQLNYPVDIQESVVAGVPVRLISPKSGLIPNQILLNAHGGGFAVDSGSLSENIPLAALTHRQVVAVRYRLSPEFAFPAARDDIIAVYQDLLKTHEAKDIVLFGTSAGAILTGEVAVRLKQLGLPQPAALGIFSGIGDFDFNTETTLRINPLVLMPSESQLHRTIDDYMGKTDRKDPMLSPSYGDLSDLPPTLLLSGTRDVFLSGTTLLQRQLLKANVDARLVVFEAMPHAHWSYMDVPEATEAFEIMAKFFDQRLHQP